MATRAFEAQLERPAFAWMQGAARRTLGLLLLVLGLWLAVSIWGFHAGDPSLDHATRAAAQNPMGTAGAVVADLMLQILGLSVWILAAVLLAWGLRMSLNRPLAWPWLPLVCLPLALLAASAWLATLHPLPPQGIWPFRVGLGGFVGDFLFARFQPHPGDALYGWISSVVAVALGVGALGLRWGESAWALGRVADASAWAGSPDGRRSGPCRACLDRSAEPARGGGAAPAGAGAAVAGRRPGLGSAWRRKRKTSRVGCSAVSAAGS